MAVKIYRYRIQPSKIDQFLEVQRLADAIYSQHFDYELRHFQSQTDSASWVEMHQYRSTEDAEKAGKLSETEPRLQALFSQFMDCLDEKCKISEEHFTDRSIR